MSKNVKKKLLNFLIVAGLLVLTAWTVFRDRDVEYIFRMMNEVQVKYKVMCFGLVILYVCCESVIMRYLLSLLGEKVKLAECVQYSFVGFFYSCITPSASGGQPMQVVYMRKNRISTAKASLVLMIITVEYKFVLVFAGLVMTAFGQSFLMARPYEIRAFFYLGLVLNVVCVTGMVMLLLFPNLVRGLLRIFFRILAKLHIVRLEQGLKKRLNRALEIYQDAAEYLSSNKKAILNTTIVSFIQRFLLFLVTYVVYRSLGFSGEHMIKIVFLQAIIAIAVDMLPLPGGMGISEHLYLMIFTPVFIDAEMTTAAMTLSRGFSYYILLIVSGLITFAVHWVHERGNNQGDVEKV